MTPVDRRDRLDRLPRRILAGSEEPIFGVLPERVLDNLRRPRSENALVWNLVYPLATPSLSLVKLLGLRPLWGTSALPLQEDVLEPYFWGYSIAGRWLDRLMEVLEEVDGPGPQTEVDLFLLGRENLILAEAKHTAALGRCSRFARARCPEIQVPEVAGGDACRYWEVPAARFVPVLDFGARPEPEGGPPPCSQHYQMARTLLVGKALAARLGLRLHVWLITPRRHWEAIQSPWGDFADRLTDEGLWRRMRVLAWEDVRALSSG